MIDTLMPLIKQFIPFAQERMKFSEPPRLFLRGDSKNAENPLGKTAHYDPSDKSITIYITNRHPKDIMRSLSHELVHHAQCCRGDLDGTQNAGLGYAQNDEHMREMEREAYEVGNMCFRDWEDGIKSTIYFEHLQKGEKKMSTKDWKNKEMGTLLSEAWGFGFNLEEQKEGFHACASHVKENSSGRAGRCINHTLTEDNQVTHYTVEFDSEIVENIPVDELTVTEEGMHSHGKRDDYKHDDKKPRRKHKVDEKQFANSDELDGDSDGKPKWADKDDPANKGKKKLDEEEEEIEERRGRGRADPRIQRAPDNRARPLEEEEELQEFRPPRNQYGNFEYNDGAPAAGGGSRGDEGGDDRDDDNDDKEEVKERRGRGRNDRHIRGTPDNRLRENIKDIIRQALRAEGIVTNGQEK